MSQPEATAGDGIGGIGLATGERLEAIARSRTGDLLRPDDPRPVSGPGEAALDEVRDVRSLDRADTEIRQ
jgi:hypothetical protein